MNNEKQDSYKPRAVIIVGQRGSGKTTFAKKILGSFKRNYLIFDPQREFLTDDNFNLAENSSVISPSQNSMNTFQDFLTIANKRKNSAIHIEEATIFLSKSSNIDKMRDLLVSLRHHNNFLFMSFHSLRKIPYEILDLIDLVYVFRTKDSISYITDKLKYDDDLKRAFLMIKELGKYEKIKVAL